ncbi:O-antigen ligase family protein [uncultured Bacteroides sp.]|uniref:O-antigen ligase family protein n=1 Tax=uncultured Bacteroides sp. TaxID=162156 RepID=UPI002AA95D65|nr:O-antigen ligase family protein [uncultured Bacteroides sp.]
MAWIFWGQSIVLGYRVTAGMLGLTYFFFLCKVKPPIRELERMIWIFAFVYILLWLYGMSKAPQLVFGFDSDRELDDSRGIFRLIIIGKSFIIAAFFLSLNKFSFLKKKKYLILVIFFFVFIVLQVVRQVILFSFLVGLYYILRNNKKMWLYLALAFMVLYFSPQIIKISDDSVLGKLIALSENQAENQRSGDENIRIQEYKFFFNDYSKNILTTFFGNGMPHANSSYGYSNERIKKMKRYFMSDVGYAQMFVVTGILGLFLYFLLFGKVFFQSVSEEFMFAKLFIIYQIPANIAASWYSTADNIIMICICIYILNTIYSRNYLLNRNDKSYEIYNSNTSI